MQKKSFLNEVFDEDLVNECQSARAKNVNKFIQCFNVIGNNRNRQIRILQIGSPGISSLAKKPFLTTQPIKKPLIGLFNNQILFPPNPTSVQKQGIMRVEAIRTGLSFQPAPHQRGQSKTISPQKNMFLAATQYVINTSPKRTRGWLARKKKVQELPKQFCRRSSQNTAVIPNDLDTQTDDIVSKSVNLLNKIKIIQQCTQLNCEMKSGSIVQHKPKARLQISKKTPQQIAQQQRKNKLEIKRQISQDYAKPFNPPSNITAESYIIFEPKFSENRGRKRKYYAQQPTNQLINQNKKKYPHSHKVVASLNSRNVVQVASLTKIMTCILALQLCQRFKLNSKQQKILISKFETNIGGTSAQISEGETYTLEDLYYGLMLPSGNDASVAIAVWGGRVLLNKQKDITEVTHKKKQFYQRFVIQMNNKAKQLGMHRTNYANSHGLCNPENRSCAYDLAILCEHAMMNNKFKQIVSCKFYKNTIQYYTNQTSVSNTSGIGKKSTKDLFNRDKDDQIQQGQEGDLDSNQQENEQILCESSVALKTVQWQNTHRLVQQKSKQYIGIKTGITTAAGPCLASCIKGHNDRYFIIIVLNCDKLSMRFKDTQNLKKWVFQRQGMMSPRKKQSNGQSPRQEEYPNSSPSH